MTSEIRTNSLKSRAGLSTVTLTDSGPMFSGITTFVDNSGFTFGVGGGTSIFTPATNVLTFGTNNTEKVRIDANGNTNIAGVTTAANFKTGVSNLHDVGLTLSGGQIDVGSNIKIGTAGVVTATTFSGSGANLTNLPAANLTGTLPAISGANLTNLPTATTITVADESSDTTCYPLFATATSGNLAPKTGTNLVFNSASGNLRTGSLFLGTGTNESKTQDGLIMERNSGDGYVHITAGRTGGNYSGFNYYVAGASGVTLRHSIDYQSNFRWYDADGTTQRVRLDNVGRFQINQNSNITGTAKLEVMGTGDNTYPEYSYAIGVADTRAYNATTGPGMGIGFSYKWNSSGQYALGCGIRGFKENTTDNNYASALAFYTRPHGSGAGEVARIDSIGQMGLSKPYTTYTDPARLYLRYKYDSSANYAAGLVIDSRPDVLSTKHIRFYYALHGSGGGSELGSVTSSNAGSVSYNTSSDYRRKKNDVAITDGIAKVKNLRPIRFNWIEQPDITEEGFFAHEAQEVVPNSVFGEKDAVDKDGKPDYQVMDHSKLVPLLTASIKELITKVETLEQENIALRARVTNLEGN